MKYTFSIILLVYKIVQAPWKTCKMYYDNLNNLSINYGTMDEKAAEELHSLKRITEGLSKLDRKRQHITSTITPDSQALCIICMLKVYKDFILTYRDKFYNILYFAYM